MEQKTTVSLLEIAEQAQSWLRYFLSRWKSILLIALLGAILGVGYSMVKRTYYTATTSFVLEEESSGMGGKLGQYAGLAATVGIDIDALGGSNGIFQGDNITALYRSQTMLRKTLLSKAKIDGKEVLMADYYVKMLRVNKFAYFFDKYKDLHFQPGFESTQSRLADSLLNVMIRDIDKKYLVVGKPDKKLNLINVSYRAPKDEFAVAFNQKLVAQVNDFYVRTKTKKSLDNIKVLQHQTDSVRAVMESAIGMASRTLDLTPNLNQARQSVRTNPVQRSQFNAEANKAILTELVKNLELSKMTFLKNKPLIQVIDEPHLPLPDDKLRKSIMAVFGATIALISYLFILAFRRIMHPVTDPNHGSI